MFTCYIRGLFARLISWIHSPQNVGEEDDEPLRRVRQHGRRRHEQEEDDEEDVGHRQEDEQPVEVGVLAPELRQSYPISD